MFPSSFEDGNPKGPCLAHLQTLALLNNRCLGEMNFIWSNKCEDDCAYQTSTPIKPQPITAGSLSAYNVQMCSHASKVRDVFLYAFQALSPLNSSIPWSIL